MGPSDADENANGAALYSLLRAAPVRIRYGERVSRFVRRELGSVSLPTARLAACDPLVFSKDAISFARPVPVGAHAVAVGVIEFEDDGDARLACALVVLDRDEPLAWEPALFPGQDPAALGPGEYYGYPVDSGTGCFASQEALAELRVLLDRYYEALDAGTASGVDDPLISAMQQTYVPTWSWADFDVGGDLNVIAFSSGWGDGFYPTYWGLGRDGSPVCALTDFIVIEASAAVRAGEDRAQ